MGTGSEALTGAVLAAKLGGAGRSRTCDLEGFVALAGEAMRKWAKIEVATSGVKSARHSFVNGRIRTPLPVCQE